MTNECVLLQTVRWVGPGSEFNYDPFRIYAGKMFCEKCLNVQYTNEQQRGHKHNPSIAETPPR